MDQNQTESLASAPATVTASAPVGLDATPQSKSVVKQNFAISRKYWIIIGLIAAVGFSFITGLVLGGALARGEVTPTPPSQNDPADNDPIACTMDAQECPDGSYVGRDPENNCEFFACPAAETNAQEPNAQVPQNCITKYTNQFLPNLEINYNSCELRLTQDLVTEGNVLSDGNIVFESNTAKLSISSVYSISGGFDCGQLIYLPLESGRYRIQAKVDSYRYQPGPASAFVYADSDQITPRGTPEWQQRIDLMGPYADEVGAADSTMCYSTLGFSTTSNIISQSEAGPGLGNLFDPILLLPVLESKSGQIVSAADLALFDSIINSIKL